MLPLVGKSKGLHKYKGPLPIKHPIKYPIKYPIIAAQLTEASSMGAKVALTGSTRKQSHPEKPHRGEMRETGRAGYTPGCPTQ